MLALPFPAIDPALFTLGPISMFGVELGPLSLRWYALAYIVGLLLGRVYVNRMLLAEARWPGGKPPVSVDETENLLIWMTLGVVLGANLVPKKDPRRAKRAPETSSDAEARKA